MFRWTSTIICVLLLQTVQSQGQEVKDENKPVEIEKDWNINQAYLDVFKILRNQNTCSDFYGGSRTATTVLNGFVIRVKSQPLLREVSFQMAGSPRIIRDPATGAFYRLFSLVLDLAGLLAVSGVASGNHVMFMTDENPVTSGRSIAFKILTTEPSASLKVSFRGKEDPIGSPLSI